MDAWIQHAPSLAVVVVVGGFLKYLTVLNKSRGKMDERRLEQMTKMGQECHNHHEKVAATFKECVDRNTKALDDSGQVMTEVRELLRAQAR